MMTPDVIRKAIHSSRPFKVRMASGKVFNVPHTDFAFLSRSGRTLLLNTRGDHFEWLDVLMIESVEQKDAKADHASL